MNWQFLISLRYLLEKRKERFISVTALISILGIAVGVAALIVTMGIMNGFNKEIEEKILSVNPHLIVGRDGRPEDIGRLKADAEGIEGVSMVSEFVDGQALFGSGDKLMGILVKGVDGDPARRILNIDNHLVRGQAALKEGSALIGGELARNYGLDAGDKFFIISPMSGKKNAFEVRGIFNSGRYDYDLSLVLVRLEEAKGLLAGEGVVSGVGIKVDRVFEVDNVKRRLAQFVRPPYWVMTWKDVDKNLFAALKLEKIVMFLLVTLIICVACFNIISTLIMTVMEKTKDIGIMKAIGVTRFGVAAVFLLEGLYISIAGIAAGAGLGLGLCYLQEEYKLVKLPPDVYYIYSVPVSVSMPDILVILVSAFALGLVATVYPSFHAARLDPIEALRCG